MTASFRHLSDYPTGSPPYTQGRRSYRRPRNIPCAAAVAHGNRAHFQDMPRAIWTGAISFGLVTVPVKLYSAVDRKTVRFHQLHGKTGTRIQQKRVDAQTGEEVPYEDIVKGYEIAPDRY